MDNIRNQMYIRKWTDDGWDSRTDMDQNEQLTKKQLQILGE